MTAANQPIIPFLWFNDNAEEAIELYTKVFTNVEVKQTQRWGKGGPGPEGTLMTASILINGQEFAMLNGGPMYQFTEAVSFVIKCDNQQEVDHYWEKLTENGGKESQCGWLKDKFGLSWQVVPVQLMQLLKNEDPQKSQRVMQAMMQMKKIDIKGLEEAAS
ncbi:MAG TPA: VOC family protein [Flavobacterium sp.]|jgi:predicted 3-demethylubiquinone-9 3-methyltransferase (glyoxalase superfamily)